MLTTLSSRRPTVGGAALTATVAALLSVAPGDAHAQAARTPHVVMTVVPGIFDLTPVTLTQNAQTGNLCSPGACYAGATTVRSNRAWQLQVRLATNPSGFSVSYVQTTVPADAQAVNTGKQTPLNTGNWLTVATGSGATAGSSIGVMFNANKAGGKTGVQPTAAQLTPVIAYQVVSYP